MADGLQSGVRSPESGARPARTYPAAGIALAAVLAIHAAELYRLGEIGDLLWACNVAAGALAVGLILESASLVGGATLVLVPGLPLWIFGVWTGERFMLTSAVLHVGGLALGAWAIARLGMPPGTWWRASACQLALIPLARVLTTTARNVDLAHRVWPGFERMFPRWDVYIAAVSAAHAALYFGLERLTRLALTR